MTEREEEIKLLEENLSKLKEDIADKDRTWARTGIKPTQIFYIMLKCLECFQIIGRLTEIKVRKEREHAKQYHQSDKFKQYQKQ